MSEGSPGDGSPAIPPGHTFVGRTPDGRIITGQGGVLHDDDYIEQEQRQWDEQRAAIVAEYGSEDAYERHCRVEAIHMPRARRDAFAAMRVDQARSLKRAVQPPRHRRTRERRPGSRRPAAHAARSSARSGDSGDDPGEPPRRRPGLRHVSHAVDAYLEQIGGAR